MHWLISYVYHIGCCKPTNDRILNYLFNNENNWIDIRFSIGSRKKVNKQTLLSKVILSDFSSLNIRPLGWPKS